jgi:antiviral helicase SKI2
MILNLLRVEDMSVESMIKRSFSEFATQRALTANEYPKLLNKGEKTLSKLDTQFRDDKDSRLGAEDLEGYYEVCAELLATNEELLSYVLGSPGADSDTIFTPGRVLLVTAARKYGYVHAPSIIIRGPGLLLGGQRQRSSLEVSGKNSIVCVVLLPESFLLPTDDSRRKSSLERKISEKPGTINFIGEAKRRHYAIHEIDLSEILLLSTTKYKIDPDSILKDETPVATSSFGSGVGSQGALNEFAGMKSRSRKREEDEFIGGKSSNKTRNSNNIDDIVLHLIDAECNESSLFVLDIRDCVKQGSDVLEYRKHCDKMEDLVIRMRSFVSHRHPSIERHYAALERKESLRERIRTLQHLLSNESLQLFPDYLQRKAVLQTLGYIDSAETVCVKGRVACEVNTCQELIATEMVFEGVLNELEPVEIVAALSALVYQEKKGNEDEFDAELPPRLVDCCMRMKCIAKNLGQLQKEHGLDVDPMEFCENSLKFGLIHVVYEWALGVTFRTITELTDIQEGSIVRCITRLDELCREIRNCARVVGNPTLYRKMELASISIKRDIVFASSLYVS